MIFLNLYIKSTLFVIQFFFNAIFNKKVTTIDRLKMNFVE